MTLRRTAAERLIPRARWCLALRVHNPSIQYRTTVPDGDADRPNPV
jgi:hypothetical protein